MSRIACLAFDAAAACEPFSTMLSSFGGASERQEQAHALVGRAGRGPGGLARHARGVLALDGLIYDISSQRAATGLPRGSDADVLAELIVRHGIGEALARVNGDFALVWLPADSREVWLARDPFGMRPLYYAQVPGGWAAASQPRALLRLDAVSARVDRGFLARYGAMHYRLIDDAPDRSPYADIAQVPAGHAIRLTSHGELQAHRYWTLRPEPDFAADAAELAGELRTLLIDAVAIRIARFPNRAFSLSGGMDSSSVLAVAVDIEQSPQVAYSTLYEDRSYDERTEIADMLDRHVSDWRTVVVPDAIDVVADVDRMIGLHDEPVATATWLSHLRLCDRAAGDGVEALFGGLGGDELNAGEYEYFPMHFADLAHAGRNEELEREIAAWVRNHDHPVFRKSPEIARVLINRLTDATRPGLCRPDLPRLGRYLHVLTPEFAEFRDFRPAMETFFESCLKTRTWQDVTRETLPCCIRAEDRHGAALGLPPVLPFLDARLVRFMYRVAGDMKIRDGVTKRLLREAMRGLLPEATRTRVKKTGWNAPAHRWFTGRGADMLRDIVHSELFDSVGLYDRAAVLALIDDHERIVLGGVPEDNHMMFLWSFLNLMRWQAWLQNRCYWRPIAGAA